MWNALILTAVFLTLANAKSVAPNEKNTPIAGVTDAALSNPLKLQAPSNLLKSTPKEFISSGVLKCGGTIRRGSGSVQYKPFETAGANERCVWIIYADRTNLFELRLDEFTSQLPEGTLTVLGLGINGAQTIITPSHESQFVMNSSVLVITFATKEIPSTRGFVLLWGSGWIAGEGDLEPASSDSIEVLVDSPLGHLKHPSNGTTYSNLEVSVFAFVPQGTCTADKRVEVLVNLLGLDPVSDFVTYFKFYDLKWLTAGRIHYGYEPQLIRSDDIILLVFTSDVSTTRSGFELTYSMC